MAMELTMGARIYRPARLAVEGPAEDMSCATPSIKDFGDGTFMLRAKPDPGNPPHWLVVPWEQDGGRVCVCDEPIPEHWTHFEVLFADVNFVAVSPVAGGQG
jgi:hypothetical protein